PGAPAPANDDFAAQELNQFLWAQNVDFPFQFAFRAELEGRAGGNPSWTTGVDFTTQLAHSADRDEVIALYHQAGLNLHADLATLQTTAPIAADPGAVSYLERFITYTGDLNMPVLTMHTIGDGLVIHEDERAYADVVHAAGDTSLLRQIWVNRAGHCAFTPAETITAFQTLIQRVNTGHWNDQPGDLNASATALGPAYNILFVNGSVIAQPPAFVRFESTVFPRPFDSRDE
ncbi:MAG TPA: hypothetical protein VGN32_16195, partial [Ktedonobacterales bacterium]|nr:hypothetical protein [Ktedonobacterales bacterium]